MDTRFPEEKAGGFTVTVGETAAVLSTLVLGYPYRHMALNLVNGNSEGGASLEGLTIEFQLSDADVWHVLYSGSVTPSAIVLFQLSTNLQKIEAEDVGWIWMLLPPCRAVRFKAAATSGGDPANSVDVSGAYRFGI